MLLKVLAVLLTTLNVSSFLKINNKKGLSKPRDITENKVERILKEKYAATNFGYPAMYLKMVRRLFIS
jgi:hypothetical protein